MAADTEEVDWSSDSEQHLKPDLPAEGSDSADRQSVLDRTAELWRAHAAESSELASETDRLKLAAAYRAWAGGATSSFCKEPPKFTDLWAALTGTGVQQDAAQEVEVAKRLPKEAAAISVVYKALKDLEERASRKAVNASLVQGSMRSIDPRLRVKATKFISMGGLLQCCANDGWVKLSRDKDDLLVQICKLPEEGEALQTLQKWAAVKGQLDEKPKDEPASSTLPGPSRKRQKTLGSQLDRAQCLEMFDTALQELCDNGVPQELPWKAEVVEGSLRKLYPQLQLSASPLHSFEKLLLAAADEGLLQVQKQKQEYFVTSVVYTYKVVPEKASPSKRKATQTSGERRPRRLRLRQAPRFRSRSPRRPASRSRDWRPRKEGRVSLQEGPGSRRRRRDRSGSQQRPRSRSRRHRRRRGSRRTGSP